MGTHPIFESDFDCLTGLDSYNRSQWQKEPRRSVSLVNTEPVMVLPWERSSRKWKFPNTRNTNHPSVVPPLSREPLWVSDVSERMLKTKYFTAISKSHSLKIEMIIAPL